MRSTIDFGIDLGTTNSAVAVLRGTTTEILKNNLDTDITPSAVYINKRGALITGMRAKEQTKHDGSEEDAHLEFKRRMGTGYEYVFPSSGRKMKPEELSAEILKSLRADVSQKLGEEMRAAVITVPAAFELHQCEATKKAAELAGLQFSALLQEPVAAALAYGYQIENSKGYWLVYDFGGGTFDAALIRAEGGNITVSNHGGDNFLGGSDIDWAIVEQILVPEVVKQFGWKDFNRANLGWRNEFAKLKYCAEQAKIELSRTDAVYLMDCRLKGPDGQIRELEYQLLTKDVIPVAERIIMRSVDITKRVLREKNLSATAIAKVILVGGPTLAPYFRQIVGGSLGIELDHSVDPLTVVARGAAVFAGTQRLEGSNAPQPKRGQFAVDLKYKPVGTEVDPMVGGRVSSPDKTQVASLSIEVVNRRSKWTTGKLKLQADGAFVATLLADKGVQNIFGIELTDAKGTRLEVVPPEFAYTVGAVVDEQPIINSIGVELADRTVEFYFKKGEGLPAKGKKDFRTAFEVKRGQTATVLEIPVVEGESDRADRNVKIGSLAITGGNIKRDLPAGSSVEVTLSIDQSRLVRVKAYVPLLDEEIETRIDLKHREPLVADLETDREEQGRRLAGLQAKAKEAKDNIALTLIRKLETSALIESLRNNLANAKADGIAALKLERDLMEFKSKLDEIEDAVEWPALTAETKRWLDDIEKLLSQFGSPEDRTKAQGFRRQIGEVISLKKTQRLRSKLKEVRAFYYQLLLEQPDFWIGYFNNLAKQTSQMRDRTVADRLIKQGRECVTANNIQGLKNAVGGLQDLLPREVAESLRKASSGIVI